MAEMLAVRLCRDKGIEVRRHAVAERTRESFPPHVCVKTLAVTAMDVCFLVGLRLCDRLDFAKLAAAVGTDRSNLKILDRRAVLRTTGFPPGAIGPFSPSEQINVWLDQAIFGAPTVFCGSGDLNVVLEVSSAALLRLPGVTVASLSSDSDRENLTNRASLERDG